MLNTAGCVSRTRSLNDLQQMTVIPIALGNKADLAVDSLRSTRGMIDSTLEDTEGFREPFMVSRLDWLWPRISEPDSPIHGVKIDVQGMEIQVLEGMAATVKRYRPKLLVELHPGVSRPQFLDVIRSLGYQTRGVPVEPLPGESDPVYADRTYFFQTAAEPIVTGN
jgi:FkbM family methyltransferase